jgi:hypothetical protein
MFELITFPNLSCEEFINNFNCGFMHQDLSDLDMPNVQIYPSSTNFWEHKRYAANI